MTPLGRREIWNSRFCSMIILIIWFLDQFNIIICILQINGLMLLWVKLAVSGMKSRNEMKQRWYFSIFCWLQSTYRNWKWWSLVCMTLFSRIFYLLSSLTIGACFWTWPVSVDTLWAAWAENNLLCNKRNDINERSEIIPWITFQLIYQWKSTKQTEW